MNSINTSSNTLGKMLRSKRYHKNKPFLDATGMILFNSSEALFLLAFLGEQ